MRTRLIAFAIPLLIAAAIIGWQSGSAELPAAPPLPTPLAIPAVPSPDGSAGPNDSAADPFARSTRPEVRNLPEVPESTEALPPLIFARTGQLYASTGDGSQPQQLTTFDETTYAEQPAVSADGAQIAFVALIQPPAADTVPLPRSALWLINRDGTALRELWAPADGIMYLPTWTPDASAIYLLVNTTYSAPDPAEDTTGVERLAIVRVDTTTGETTIVRRGALDPVLSADGSQMAFLNFGSDGIVMHLDIVATAGGEPRRVVDGTRFSQLYAPRFSPDGRQIIFSAVDGPETDDAGYPLRATSSLVETLAALLAPPTAAAHGAPWDLWIVGSDGTGLRRLTWLYEDLPMGAFSPDGTQIAVLGYNGVYLLNPDGSQVRRLVLDPGHSGGIAWPAR